MERSGRTVDDFRREFGKNYPKDEDMADAYALFAEAENSFQIIDEDVSLAY